MRHAECKKVRLEPSPPVHEPCFSLPRLAEHFGVSRQRVWVSVHGGDVPHFRIGNLYRVRLSDIPESVIQKWQAPKAVALRRCMPVGEAVYFVAAANGPIKIGLSRDPVTRLARLNTSSPIRLRLAAVRLGGLDVEREYHQRFAEHRLNGEWFNPHPDILAEIERLNAQQDTPSAVKKGR